MKQDVAKFRFLGFKIPHSLIDIKEDASTLNQDLSVSINARGNIKEGNKFILRMDVAISDEDKNVSIRTNLMGEFEFDTILTEKELDSLFCANAPAIMFPYVRAYITSLTALSGIDTIILPTLNMTRLGKEIKHSIGVRQDIHFR